MPTPLCGVLTAKRPSITRTTLRPAEEEDVALPTTLSLNQFQPRPALSSLSQLKLSSQLSRTSPRDPPRRSTRLLTELLLVAHLPYLDLVPSSTSAIKTNPSVMSSTVFEKGTQFLS